ncbi:related to HXT2 - Hexose facilitator of moderately low affinity for glucose [Cephalotrichum gorgonifer]|uniref:Related to HXT2 - Hexose facilitator of moderately low affinity for glucose n=1 Tax=Cephalotrichum gorgonifer TaxID=2041049 RepID=A0AAE8SZW7_9PEZI|nr:related to HXT2 - Hexose facilitator of moderately low affinity for glucose [Cephalotrichum gorgonifer]
MGKLQYPYVWLFCGFAALGACLYGYDGVYFNGVSTLDVFIEHFGEKNNKGEWEISPSSLSIMTSMINVGELVGSLSAAPLNDYFGRKGVFLTATVTIIIGIVLQLVTTSSRALMTAGRAILGYGVGSFSATSPLYMAEISPVVLRGQVLMCWQLTLSVSQILAAGINRGMVDIHTTFAYRFPIGFQLLFPILVLAGIWFVPESPRWLVGNGRVSKAESALRSIHRDDKTYDPRPALRQIQVDIDREAEVEAESGWLQLVTDPVERRKVIFSAGALIAQQVNGIQWFYYFGTVFSKSIGLEDPFLMTLIVFLIQVFVVLASVLLANKMPRRGLLLVTTGIMMISIFVVGCLGIPGNQPSETIGKVIISFVIIEIVAFNFAWGPLGWTIASEMAVGRNRNKIYAIAVGSFWVTVWVIVFTLPYIYYSANLGPKTGFVYTGLSFITLAYVYFCVGEVKGRSMEEINGFFRDGIPARKWRDQPWKSEAAGSEYGMEKHGEAAFNEKVEA